MSPSNQTSQFEEITPQLDSVKETCAIMSQGKMSLPILVFNSMERSPSKHLVFLYTFKDSQFILRLANFMSFMIPSVCMLKNHYYHVNRESFYLHVLFFFSLQIVVSVNICIFVLSDPTAALTP